MFDEILKKYPYNDDILFKRCICQEELDKKEDAIKSFDEALNINPDNIECLYQKGKLFRYFRKKR